MSLDISLHQQACYNTEVYTANITHNLGSMAKSVLCFGVENHEKVKYITLYDILWHGSGQSAKVIAPMLVVGLQELGLDNSDYDWTQFNPGNGWGDYDLLVLFTENLLEACRMYPETTLYCHR